VIYLQTHTPYNNQLIQTTTGHKDEFIPVFNSSDNNMFAYYVDNNLMAPTFVKGDSLIISPETWATLRRHRSS